MIKNLLKKASLFFHKNSKKQNTMYIQKKAFTFFHMTSLPPKKSDAEGAFSEWVIVFDKNDSMYFGIGYYDYEANKWETLENEPMALKCWCFAPDPTSFWNKEEFKTIYYT